MPLTRPDHTPPASGSDEIRTVSFVSLGCPKNLVDSEKMLGMLAQDGLAVVSCGASTGSEEPGLEAAMPGATPMGGKIGPTYDADAVVINTCGFLEASKDE